MRDQEADNVNALMLLIKLISGVKPLLRSMWRNIIVSFDDWSSMISRSDVLKVVTISRRRPTSRGPEIPQ